MAKLLGKFTDDSVEWHEARKGRIGGSMVGTVAGLNPWESAVTCFYKFTGQIDDDVLETDAMRLGKLLEAPLVEMFRFKHPEFVVEHQPGTFLHDGNDKFLANPDGLISVDGVVSAVLEIKTSRDYWVEPPRHYVAQVHWYMWILGLRKAFIAGHIGGSWKEFEVDFDDEFMADLLSKVEAFLVSVESLSRPEWDGSDSTYETVRELNPDFSDDSVELDSLGLRLRWADADLRKATLEFNTVRSMVLDVMGSAKTGLLNGERICYRQKASNGKPFLKIVGKE